MRRRSIFRALVASVAVALVAVPLVLAAPSGPTAGQRVDLKVLVVSPSATDGVFGAWKETLAKLGVPYAAYVSGQSPPITDATLADYAGNHALYQGVIITSSAVPLSAAERAALDKLETTFGVREISDNTNPDSAHGATPISGVTTTATPNLTGTLTAAGNAVFPYLKGPVPLGGPSFAASGTPGPNFTSLVNAPGGGSYLGVFKRPNGTEQLIDGIPGNSQQIHYQLLRYGLVNWVTRGVYLGYWRNYFEVQVDDLFLADDAWDVTAHANNYDPLVASRMTPADLAKTLAWSQANHFRFDFAYNAGGHFQYLETHPAGDPLWDAMSGPAGAVYRNAFGWINHTYDHPFLGCSSANYITWEISQNVAAGRALGLPVNGAELVTGEHSGLANTKPGNPGVLDPPSFDNIDPVTGGTLAPGTYFYSVTVSNGHGQTQSPAPVSVVVAAPDNAVTVSMSRICKGTTYALYRGAAAAGPWTLVAQTPAQNPDTPTDNGAAVTPLEVPVTLTDTGTTVAPAANVAAVPPTANTAVMDPYPMNPQFTTGLANANVAITASDASKTYPIETSAAPAPVNGPQNPAGAAFNLLAPGGRVITTFPRYPTNVYYNASKQGQELDEYNWIYNAAKGCIPIANVTTCNTADVTWDTYLATERNIVFGHITGNDPRPHYAHQSNFADYNAALPETDPNQGGILYPYLGQHPRLLPHAVRRQRGDHAADEHRHQRGARPPADVGGQRRLGSRLRLLPGQQAAHHHGDPDAGSGHRLAG